MQILVLIILFSLLPMEVHCLKQGLNIVVSLYCHHRLYFCIWKCTFKKYNNKTRYNLN